MVKCNNCGITNPENAKYCQECGNQLIYNKAFLDGEKENNNELPKRNIKTDNKMNQTILIIVASAIIGFLIGYAIMVQIP
jgi:uncharacterized membrane protein YvbJ